MKKYFILFAAICAAVAVSCTPKELVIDTPAEEGVSDVKLIPITITASLEGTKADMVDVKWTWQSGDKLAVYDGTDKREFTLDESAAGTAVAKFTGEVAETFTSLQAVFPYAAAGATFDTPIIPAEQTIPSGATIDPAAMIAIAESAEKVSDDEFNFYFTSGVSMLRFTVPDGVQKVILHTEGKEAAIAGASRSVTVNVPGAGQYWAAVNPASYEGMKVFARTSNGDFLKSTASTIDLSAPGKAKNLGTLGAGTSVVVIENGDELVSYLGSETAPTLDAYVVNDLNLTGKTVVSCEEYAKVFDGLYHSIKNWTSNGVSLFFSTTTAGIVKNMTIDASCSITPVISSSDDPYFGVFVGNLKGTASNLINESDIVFNLDGSLQSFFGAIVGRTSNASARIISCTNKGSVTINLSLTAEMGGTQYFGGVIGLSGRQAGATWRMTDCTNDGDITVNATNPGTSGWLSSIYTGGICGGTGFDTGSAETTTGYATSIYGGFSECINNGNITVSWNGGTGGYFNTGGILGYGQVSLKDCTNNGDISFTNSDTVGNARPGVGGIAGGLIGPGIDNVSASGCVNYGKVSLSGLFSNAGNAYGGGIGGCVGANIGGCFGVVGEGSLEIADCINYGAISASTKMEATLKSWVSFGGVVGWSKAEINGCKNASTEIESFSTTARTAQIGGIVGDCYKPINDCESSATIKVSHDCESLTIDGNTYPKPVSNVGGIVGYAENDCALNGCSNTGNALTLTNMTTDSRVGGVSGMQRSDVIGCSNSATISVTRKKIVPEGYAYAPVGRYGGVIGYQNVNKTIKDNHNTGDMFITLDNISSAAAIGGVLGIGQVVVTLDNCDNEGDVTVNGGGIKKSVWLGGIAGATNVTKSKLINCDNTGNITLSNAVSTDFSYVGGVWGYYKDGGNICENCNNSGNLTSTAAAKVRVAGLAAALYGTVTNSSSTSIINVSNALAGSRVAGYIGYASCGITGGSVSSTINAGAAGTSHAGLVFGDMARNNTIKDFTVDGSLTADSNFKAGLLFGGFGANTANYTLGASGSPLTIKSTASVNGVSPSVAPSTIEEVIGDPTTNFVEGTTNIVFTNVVLN